MKKLLALLLALVLCLGVLVACDTSEESSSSSSSEEQSTSTEGPTLEESSSPSEEPAEIVYYNEIKGFILKDDAPEFKLCKSYNELLAMLEAPLQNFDENIFEGNYVLMIKNAIYSGASGYLGFANISLEGNELTIEWHLQAVDGRDYTAEEYYMNALIVLPKADINGPTEKVVVSPKYNKINNDSEIVKSFR